MKLLLLSIFVFCTQNSFGKDRIISFNIENVPSTIKIAYDNRVGGWCGRELLFKKHMGTVHYDFYELTDQTQIPQGLACSGSLKKNLVWAGIEIHTIGEVKIKLPEDVYQEGKVLVSPFEVLY